MKDLSHLEMPSVSVVIPTYKRPQSLLRLLDLLAEQKHIDFGRMDVVVVNDGSHEHGYQESYYDGYPYELTYIKRDRDPDDLPRSVATANQGVQASQGDIVVLMDDGLVIDDHTIFIHCLYQMLLAEYRPVIYPAETFTGDRFQGAHGVEIQGPGKEILDIFVTDGSNSIRRADWDRVGGKDEEYDTSMGFDDLDLALRLYRDGCLLVRADGVTRWNEDSETFGSWTVKFAERDNHRNGELFLSKWPIYREVFG